MIEFIERKGYKRADLARLLDVDVSTVSAWCQGRNTPTYEKCEQLIKLGIFAEELYSEEVAIALKKSCNIIDYQTSFPFNLSTEEMEKIVLVGLSSVLSKTEFNQQKPNRFFTNRNKAKQSEVNPI